MIYNFNLGIGWASSGVEYAQAYRAKLLRNVGEKAKFVFTDMFLRDNIQAMTKNIGFLDDEVIWLYTFFTDTKISPVTYTLDDLVKTFDTDDYQLQKTGSIYRYIFKNDTWFTVYLEKEDSNKVHRVEIVSHGCLIRKDYYTYCRIFSEYYAPFDNRAHLYARRYFNEDGSCAYEEVIDDEKVFYKFSDRVLYSKEELVGYMVECLNLTDNDIVIIDRTTGVGQSIMQNAGRAKIGIVIHADHFSEGSTNDTNILWNNYYEYSFNMHKHISFYIASTDAQRDLLKEQFRHYLNREINCVTIPVGGLTELKKDGKRKKHSIITASRLAGEKHVDWIIDAAVKAREIIPDLTLDIYGKGGEEDNLRNQINKNNAGEYIHLCGQQNLEEVYKNYEAYVSGSTSEGFGLTLMEAVGSGLAMVGFDVRYGNPTFIINQKNGYLIPVTDKMERKDRVDTLAHSIIKMFGQKSLKSMHDVSYKIAEQYLAKEVEQKWKDLIQTMK